MRKIIIYILSSVIIIIITTIFLIQCFSLNKENIISIISFYTIIFTAILVYLQLQVNLNFNKRKEAIDFSFDKISNELFSLLKELKNIIGKDLLIFMSDETFEKTLSSETNEEKKSKIKKITMDVLNFYERMSIGILKRVYDEDICYDDNGLNLILFYKWTESFIVELQKKHDPRIFINFQHIARKWQSRHLNDNIKLNKMVDRNIEKGTIQNKTV